MLEIVVTRRGGAVLGGRQLAGSRLGSPHALRCAAAQGLGRALIAFVTYDKRLAECAQSLGIPTQPAP